MSSALVGILWPSSVFFTAVLSFRIGVWWQLMRQPGRHKFVPGRCHSDEADAYLETEEVQGADAAWLPGLAATAGDEHWPHQDDDTDFVPRLQDIRPPTRATPIRRPPWV